MIIQGDARTLPLRDESVDLIVTSPPYFALRSYRDSGEHYEGQVGSEPTPQDFLEALWECTREMVRVLKPSGSIFVNLGDKYAGSGGNNQSGLSPAAQKAALAATGYRGGPRRYNQESGGVRAKSLMGLPWRYAIGCIDQLGLILRAEIVWQKPNGLPESVRDRVRRSHEQWFHLTKSEQYFAAVDEIREPQQSLGERHEGRSGYVGAPDYIARGFAERALNPLGKLPGSVWSIASEPLKVPAELGIDHFAAFPTEWPRRLILGWSPSGVCVGCGEGRRPVVDKENRVVGTSTRSRSWNLPTDDGLRETGLTGRDRVDTEQTVKILGYACACPEPTADTTPSVILDPFGGTGTVALVAEALGRIGISVDLSHDYSRLARWRVNESGHGAKALRRTWAERQQAIL